MLYLNGIISYFKLENSFSLFSPLNLMNIISNLFRGRNSSKGLPQSTVSNFNVICLEKLRTKMLFLNNRPKAKAKKYFPSLEFYILDNLIDNTVWYKIISYMCYFLMMSLSIKCNFIYK